MRWLLFFLLLVWNCAAQSRPGEPLRIGMSAAFQGPSRALGIELYRGAQAYFQKVNAAGGVHGRPIQLVVRNDGYNPGPAVLNTIDLVHQEKVLFLFGYVGTPTVTRVLPLLKGGFPRQQLLMFPLTGAQPQRMPPYEELCFNLRASYREETAGLIDHLYNAGCHKTGIFYQCDAYGRSGWEGTRRALTERKLKLGAEATYRRGSKYEDSYAAQVKILRDAGVDHVICVGTYAPCAGFIRDARDQGWKIPIANVSFVSSESMLALLLKESKKTGRDYTRYLVNSQVVPTYHDIRLPAVREYRQAMDAGAPVPDPALLGAGADYQPLRYSFVSFEGYLCAKMLVEILRRSAPDYDQPNIRRAAESIHDFPLGLESPVSFSKQQHQGLHTVYFTRVQGDQFVPLSNWKAVLSAQKVARR
ncbi:MAG: ABC transporter substrate-binding protein [Candidatus Eremiobacteraeota bacterium]|nr:ABC transporter substrate-binding protein [Candidatus Eremiobacteraeota bacterium]